MKREGNLVIYWGRNGSYTNYISPYIHTEHICLYVSIHIFLLSKNHDD